MSRSSNASSNGARPRDVRHFLSTSALLLDEEPVGLVGGDERLTVLRRGASVDGEPARPPLALVAVWFSARTEVVDGPGRAGVPRTKPWEE